jgi:Fe-S-cluster containining protein
MLKVIQNSSPTNNLPWYKEGLPFECTGCGQCCTGSPGYIWVSEEEIQNIAEHLNLTVKEFSRLYLRWVKGRLSLLEMPKSYDCIFLKDKKCQIYLVRPTQCRTYPWWPQNLTSEKEWQEAASFCEGIRKSAPVVPFETIEEQLSIQTRTHDNQSKH